MKLKAAAIGALAISAIAVYIFLGRDKVVLEVRMYDDRFEPASVTIKKGETVRFVNLSSEDRWPASNVHPTHDIYPEFDPAKPISAGGSWSFRFNEAGIWRYHDHLDAPISGVVIAE